MTFENINNNYEINTAHIFQDLQNNWLNFEREFLVNNVQEAFETLLRNRNIVTVSFDGKNGNYLKNYENVRYIHDLKESENVQNFPIVPYFFKQNRSNSEYFDIVSLESECIVEFTDYDFDLFYALKLVFVDIMEIDDFLSYQLGRNFNNESDKYQSFLAKLTIKYGEFLKAKHEPLIVQFLNSNVQSNDKSSDEPIKDDDQLDNNPKNDLAKDFTDKSSDEPIKDDDQQDNNPKNDLAKDFTTGRKVLAMHYILKELNVNQIDKTEIARFIQFLTGDELNTKKISNTNIYKKLKSPFSTHEPTLLNDLRFIRNYFEKLNLQNIVNEVNKEISDKEK